MIKYWVILFFISIPFLSFSQKEEVNEPFYRIYPKEYSPSNYRVIKRLDDGSAIVKYIPGTPEFKGLDPILDNDWKLGPGLQQFEKNQLLDNYYLVQTMEPALFKKFAAINDINVIHTDVRSKSFKIQVDDPKVLKDLLRLSYTTFLSTSDESKKEEATIRSANLAINGIEYVRANYPELQGANINVSVKERNFIENDLDVIGRTFISGSEDEIPSLHATEMATLIAGAGNTFITGRGVAPSAQLTSTTYNNLFPEPDEYFQNNNISVQNHSYGVSINNYYGIESQSFDQLHYTNSKLITVLSAGNSGNGSSTEGIYANIEGYANITGSFKQAKNNLLVGALDTTISLSPLSSRGPAYDGRIKPELTAYGGDGTSEAAALVSGSIALLQDYYLNLNMALPSSSLIKSVLVAGADDLNDEALSWGEGFGNLNLINSLEILEGTQFFEGVLNSNDTIENEIAIPANVNEFRLALAWIDPAANPGDYKALLNNLEIKLTNLSTQEVWYPWVLNSAADIDSLTKDAVRGLDSLNNIELISLKAPVAGNYLIQIRSQLLTTESQPFSVAYNFTSLNTFRWLSPVDQTKVEAGEQYYVHWSSTYGAASGDIDVSYGDGTWQSLQPGLPLTKGYQKVLLKDTTALVNLRMKIGTSEYISDTFAISPLIKLEVGYDCEDEALLQWLSSKDASGYALDRLEEKYFEPIINTTDTLHVIDKLVEDKLYFALAPIIGNGKTGLRSPAINYQDQAIGCYIKNFFGFINDDDFGELFLGLSSDYKVDQISVGKIGPDQESNALMPDALSKLDYRILDEKIQDGISFYQAFIQLDNGKTVTSDSIALVYLNKDQALVFPNPLIKGQGLSVITETIDPIFQLLDTQGKPVYQTQFQGTGEFITLDHIRSGLYIYQIFDRNTIIEKGRLIIMDIGN